MHSLVMVCNLLAISLLQKTVFQHFSYSSVRDISTTALNVSLSDTVSFLEKETANRLPSIFRWCQTHFQLQPDNQVTMGPMPWVALTGLLSDKQDPFGHLGTASSPEDCGHGGALPTLLLYEGLRYTAWGCSTPCSFPRLGL